MLFNPLGFVLRCLFFLLILSLIWCVIVEPVFYGAKNRIEVQYGWMLP